MTEIYDYFRLLFARIGIPHCPQCGKVIAQQTVDQMVDSVLALEEGTRIQILAPVVRGRKGEYTKLIQDARKNGYVRIRIDGEVMDINDEIKLDKNRKHTIEIVVDRLIVRPGIQKRLSDSIETSLNLSGGLLVSMSGKEEMLFSQNFMHRMWDQYRRAYSEDVLLQQSFRPARIAGLGTHENRSRSCHRGQTKALTEGALPLLAGTLPMRNTAACI